MEARILNFLETLFAHEDENSPIYVVGGTLRDRFSGQDPTDFDFASMQAPEIARTFSEHMEATLITLDDTPNRETYRVALKNRIFFDFTRLQGTTLEEDLSQRDLTINAMGQSLEDFINESQEVVDPHGGLEDINNRVIRMLPGKTFEADPLRILRALRFAVALEFEIEPDTLHKMIELKSLLPQVSEERISHEIQLIFKEPESQIDLLVNTGILETVIFEFRRMTEGMDTLRKKKFWENQILRLHSLERLLTLPETLFPDHAKEFQDYLLHNERSMLLKTAGVLFSASPSSYTGKNILTGQIRPPKTNPILKRLKWSHAATRFITRTITLAKNLILRSHELKGEAQNLTLAYRFSHDSGDEFLASILLSSALMMEENKNIESIRQFMVPLLDFYFRIYLPAQNQPPLLNGDVLFEKLGLNPSPIFQKILERVEEARVLGIISSKEEAETMAKRLSEQHAKD